MEKEHMFIGEIESNHINTDIAYISYPSYTPMHLKSFFHGHLKNHGKEDKKKTSKKIIHVHVFRKFVLL